MLRTILIGALAIVVPLELAAQSVTTSSSRQRAAIFESQTRLMDSRLRSQYSSSDRLAPRSSREIEITPRYTGSRRSEFLPVAQQVARRHGIPEDLFLRLIRQESGWNPNAVSHKGAIGLAQLMPGTARALGVNPRNPRENLEGGARYLAQQYRKFGSWRLALAAYNAGPGAVEKHGGVPPYKETRNYVRVIMGRG